MSTPNRPSFGRKKGGAVAAVEEEEGAALPLSCGFAAIVAQTLPFPCYHRGKDMHLSCVSVTIVAKALPFASCFCNYRGQDTAFASCFCCHRGSDTAFASCLCYHRGEDTALCLRTRRRGRDVDLAEHNMMTWRRDDVAAC